MTSGTCSAIGSLLVGMAIPLAGCAVAPDTAMPLPEPDAEVSGYESEGIPEIASGTGYAPPDARDPFPPPTLGEDDDAPKPPSDALPRPDPLLAQASGDDDSAKEPEDDVTLGKVTRDLAGAKGTGARVEIQQQVIEEGIEDADDLNDELAEIIEQLRLERGLDEEVPYVSPIQQIVDPIIEVQNVESNPEKVAQDVRKALDEMEEPRAEGATPYDDAPQDQDQDQTSR